MESHSDLDTEAALYNAISDNTPHTQDSSSSSLSHSDNSSNGGQRSKSNGQLAQTNSQVAETNALHMEGLQNIETTLPLDPSNVGIIEVNSQLTETSSLPIEMKKSQCMDGTQSIETGFPPHSNTVEIIETSGLVAETNGQCIEKNSQLTEMNGQNINITVPIDQRWISLANEEGSIDAHIEKEETLKTVNINEMKSGMVDLPEVQHISSRSNELTDFSKEFYKEKRFTKISEIQEEYYESTESREIYATDSSETDTSNLEREVKTGNNKYRKTSLEKLEESDHFGHEHHHGTGKLASYQRGEAEEEQVIREHLTQTLQSNASTGEIVEEIVRVLKQQQTHDLLCPVCGSCVTRRVILRKRKRTSVVTSINGWSKEPIMEDEEAIQAVEEEESIANQLIEPNIKEGVTEAFGCLSCFTIFYIKGARMLNLKTYFPGDLTCGLGAFIMPDYPWGICSKQSHEGIIMEEPGGIHNVTTSNIVNKTEAFSEKVEMRKVDSDESLQLESIDKAQLDDVLDTGSKTGISQGIIMEEPGGIHNVTTSNIVNKTEAFSEKVEMHKVDSDESLQLQSIDKAQLDDVLDTGSKTGISQGTLKGEFGGKDNIGATNNLKKNAGFSEEDQILEMHLNQSLCHQTFDSIHVDDAPETGLKTGNLRGTDFERSTVDTNSEQGECIRGLNSVFLPAYPWGTCLSQSDEQATEIEANETAMASVPMGSAEIADGFLDKVTSTHERVNKPTFKKTYSRIPPTSLFNYVASSDDIPSPLLVKTEEAVTKSWVLIERRNWLNFSKPAGAIYGENKKTGDTAIQEGKATTDSFKEGQLPGFTSVVFPNYPWGVSANSEDMHNVPMHDEEVKNICCSCGLSSLIVPSYPWGTQMKNPEVIHDELFEEENEEEPRKDMACDLDSAILPNYPRGLCSKSEDIKDGIQVAKIEADESTKASVPLMKVDNIPVQTDSIVFEQSMTILGPSGHGKAKDSSAEVGVAYLNKVTDSYIQYPSSRKESATQQLEIQEEYRILPNTSTCERVDESSFKKIYSRIPPITQFNDVTSSGAIYRENKKTGDTSIQEGKATTDTIKEGQLPGFTSVVFPNYPWGVSSNSEDMHNVPVHDEEAENICCSCGLSSLIVPFYPWGIQIKKPEVIHDDLFEEEKEEEPKRDMACGLDSAFLPNYPWGSCSISEDIEDGGDEVKIEADETNKASVPLMKVDDYIKETDSIVFEQSVLGKAKESSAEVGVTFLNKVTESYIQYPYPGKESATQQMEIQEEYPILLNTSTDDITTPLLVKTEEVVTKSWVPSELQNWLNVSKPADLMPEYNINCGTHPSIPDEQAKVQTMICNVSNPSEVSIMMETVLEFTDGTDFKDSESWDILKSIVYGGLDISIGSFGVISSAAGGKSTTRTAVYMGFATLIAGLIMFFHTAVNLFHQNNIQYREAVGKTLRFNGSIAILSYLFFGMLAPLTYVLTFRESDDRDYKFFATAAVSLVSVIILSMGKAYVFNKSYRSTVSAYAVSGVLSSLVGYLTGQFLTELLEKWGLKDQADPE